MLTGSECCSQEGISNVQPHQGIDLYSCQSFMGLFSLLVLLFFEGEAYMYVAEGGTWSPPLV